jgi:excisionase family DNA binding protein
VATLRKDHGIAVYREGERAERGEATLDEAAERLAVSPATVRRLIVEGVLPASQICKGAPWVIRIVDIQLAEVVSASERRRKRTPERPPSGDQPALLLNFQ